MPLLAALKDSLEKICDEYSLAAKSGLSSKKDPNEMRAIASELKTKIQECDIFEDLVDTLYDTNSRAYDAMHTDGRKGQPSQFTLQLAGAINHYCEAKLNKPGQADLRALLEEEVAELLASGEETPEIDSILDELKECLEKVCNKHCPSVMGAGSFFPREEGQDPARMEKLASDWVESQTEYTTFRALIAGLVILSNRACDEMSSVRRVGKTSQLSTDLADAINQFQDTLKGYKIGDGDGDDISLKEIADLFNSGDGTLGAIKIDLAKVATILASGKKAPKIRRMHEEASPQDAPRPGHGGGQY